VLEKCSVSVYLFYLQLLQHSSTVVPWEPDLLHVIETVEKRGVKELSQEAAQALRLLLLQVNRVHTCVHAHAGTQRHTMKSCRPHAEDIYLFTITWKMFVLFNGRKYR